MSRKNKLVKPFIKWAGGKRQLLPEIKKRIPDDMSTYYEPFVGGGAVLFDLQPKKAIINDANEELVNVYEVIRDNVDGLIRELKHHKETLMEYREDENKEEKNYYYEVRAWDRKDNYDSISDLKKAGRIIFLNKTCFNGLFRVNLKNQFNVPFGRYKNPAIVNEEVLRAVSHYLNNNNIRITNEDFEEAMKGMRKQAFVYFDPPYHPISDSSSFTGYTVDGFDEKDQRRLKKLCDNLDERGCRFMLSNSSAPLIQELYEPNYEVEYIGANRSINSDGDKRGEVKEVLVRNFEIGG